MDSCYAAASQEPVNKTLEVNMIFGKSFALLFLILPGIAFIITNKFMARVFSNCAKAGEVKTGVENPLKKISPRAVLLIGIGLTLCGIATWIMNW